MAQYIYYSQEGMEQELEYWLRYFREQTKGTVMERVQMFLYDCDFEKKTMTVELTPDAWMADRTGDMSDGAFSIALDETMGILGGLYFADKMTPTITMQMSKLRPIPIGKKLYIRAKLLSYDGMKLDLTATAWSEGMKDTPACTAVGVYFAGGKLNGRSKTEEI